MTQQAEGRVAGRARTRLCVALLALGAVALTSASAGAHSERSLGAVPRPVKAAKLDSSLATLAVTARTQGVRAAVRRARAFGLPATATGVRVQLQVRDAGAATAAVHAAGGTVLGRYRNLIDARIPARALARVAASRAVQRVQQPVRPHADAVVDEAVKLTGAANWITAGTAGKGVT